MGKKKDKKLSQIARLIAASDRKVRSAKIERKEAQCNCMHKSNGGKLRLRPSKKGKTIFKCKDCKDKVNFEIMTNGTADQIMERIDNVCNEFGNLCNIAKITINPKYDGKFAKRLAKAQFLAYQVKKYSKASLVENFEPSKGKKGKKDRGGKNFNKFMLGGGGMSFGR
jgi:hypothetical protein